MKSYFITILTIICIAFGCGDKSSKKNADNPNKKDLNPSESANQEPSPKPSIKGELSLTSGDNFVGTEPLTQWKLNSFSFENPSQAKKANIVKQLTPINTNNNGQSYRSVKFGYIFLGHSAESNDVNLANANPCASENIKVELYVTTLEEKKLISLDILGLNDSMNIDFIKYQYLVDLHVSYDADYCSQIEGSIGLLLGTSPISGDS